MIMFVMTGNAFTLIRHLNRHKETMHVIREKHLKCELCSFQTNEVENFKNRIKRKHEKIRDHVCCDCGYAASRKDHLKRHKETMHGTRDK